MKGSGRRQWHRSPRGSRRGCEPHRPAQFAAVGRRLSSERVAAVSIVRLIRELVAEEKLVFVAWR